MFTKKIILCFSLCLLSQTIWARPWVNEDDPKYFNISVYEYEFLQKQGKLDLDSNGMWSGYHWPNKVDSLNYRAGNQKFSPLEKWEQVQTINPKFDIREMLAPYIAEQDVHLWGGLCHGYSATAIYFKEPTKKTIDDVTFFHSDIKGLLAAYYDYLSNQNLVRSNYLGLRCDENLPEGMSFGESLSPACDDVNAGAFHLALNHRINNEKKAFVMDMNSGVEVWNVPVIAYESEILNEDYPSYSSASESSAKIVHVKTKVSYLGYQMPEHDFEIPGLKGQKVKTKIYEYTLEVSTDGIIVGGEWIGTDRPDFLWFTDDIPYPSGEWQILGDLLKD
ncbi:MAG: hypothetical protein ACJAS4_001464 [Bacteriovoracaceae bacterium]|jgi:hypothetical protein